MEPEITDTEVRDILRPVTIIKVYETTTIDQFGSKTTTTDAVKYREHNCRNIQIMDEPEVGAGYTVTNWQESRDVTTPATWKDVEKVSFIRKSTGSRTITTYPDTKILYVHLEHINQVETKQTELILRESEITRAFMTQEVEDWGYQLMKYKWGDFGGTCSVNMGCQCDPCNCVTTDESGNEVGTCDCRDQCNKNYSVTDGTYNLLTKVGVSNNKVIPILDPFKALEEFGVYHSGVVNSTEAG